MSPAAQQAGGGAGDTQRTIQEIDDHIKAHLRRIYDSHSGGDEKWTPEKTKSFLQGQGRGDDADTGSDTGGLDWDGFVRYMTSSRSAITTDPKPTDLSWPLCSYFISSSHNTYLSGNQLSSASTTEAYTNVLQRGCRCVEIDVWDGDDDSDSESSSDDEPTAQRKQQLQQQKKKNRLSRISTFKDKLPDSLTARLDKTSLGKKLEEREAKKEGAAAVKSQAASSDTGSGKAKSKEASKEEVGTPEVAVVEPRVLHGYTLTKEITFRDVCVAIGKSAFAVSDTPLIVSLEVHCSPAQQATMVQIMKETWSQYLVPTPEEDNPSQPSPAELKNKILIKVKYAPPGSSPDEAESTDDERAPPPEEEDKTKQQKKGKKAASKIIQDLSRMGVYTRGVSFKSFEQPEASMPTHIFSLSEKKFLDHHENNNAQLWEHNKNFLMRAYPAGTRITSSNLNPAPFWGCGTQVVALNWQQTDEGTMLNEGLFAGTGGYVLKPEGYRPEVSGKPTTSKIVEKTLSNLTFTFYAAQNIPIPPEDKSDKSFEPYIKVELHVDACEGLHGKHINNEGHEREGEYKSRTRTHKGRDIDLAAEKLEFKGIPGVVEELTFVRFTVRDDEIGKDDLAAWACVRLDRLGEGYRFVHLLDSEGRLTEGAVLVKVEKKID